MNKRTEQTRWTPKRLLSLLMALIMTLSLLPTAALAEASDYKVTVTNPLETSLLVGQESNEITANLTDNTTGSTPKRVRLRVTVTTPIGTGNCTIQYKDSNGTYVPANDGYLDDGTNYLSVSSDSPAFAIFKLKCDNPARYSYTVEAFEEGSTAGTWSPIASHYTTSFWGMGNIENLAVTPNNPEAGQPFTVRADTNVNNGYVVFEYNGVQASAPVNPLLDNKGYAEYKEFTAVAGANNVKATLTGAAGIPPAEKSVTFSVGMPATYHTVTFLAGAADAYIPFVATATVKGGDNYIIPTDKPTRKGYTFDGWTDGANTYVAGGTIQDVTKDIVLSAKWTATPVTIEITNAGAALGVDVTNPRPNSSIGSEAHFTVKVPVKYNTADLLVFAGDLTSSYIIPVPVARVETADGVMLYYQFTVTEDLVDPATSKLNVTVSNFIEKTFTVMMPTGHFNAEITGVDTAGSTAATDKKSASIVYDGSYTFTVTPDTGYDVAVYVNGVAQTATGNSYTVTDVTGPQRVEVVESAIPNYNVTFTVPLSGQFFTQSVTRGGNASKPGVDPEREGYKFDGWYTEAAYNAPGGTKFDFDTETITKDTVLFGKLTPKTYTIKYDLNSGNDTITPATIAAQSKTHGLAEKLSETVPTREGYTFLGWGTTDKATAASYQPGDMYSVDGDITLYAVWEINKYTVTLPGGAGYTTAPTGTNSVDWGSNFTFTVIVDREYAANEPTVKYSTDGGTTWITIGSTGTVSDNSAATWTYTIQNVKTNCIVSIDVARNTTYTVSFITATLDNGTVTARDAFLKQSVEHGYYAPTPAAPEREGFKFLGYYAKKDTATSTMADYESFPFEQQILKDTNIYAIYAPIKPVITWPAAAEQVGYTIVVKGTKTGEAAESELTIGDKVAYGSKVTFTITVADGYDASKMQVGVNGILYAPNEKNGNVYTFEFTAKVDTKITVVGIERKTVTIIYNANARDDVSGLPSPQVVKYYLAALGKTGNDKITTQVPSRTGYTFLGWNTDSEAKEADARYTAEMIRAGAASEFTQDTTLYAIWKAQDTTLTLNITDVALDKNDGKRVIQYEGEQITLQATLNVSAKGTVVFYKGDKEGTNGTRIGSAAINGKTAELVVKVGEYKTTDKDEYYWAVFESETDEGYANSEKSNIMNVGVFSKAITWPLDTKNADTLTITEATGSMTAGKTYKLTVDITKILGLETVTPNNAPKLGEDYAIVWQYKNTVTGDWADMSAEITDTNEYQVTPEYAGHEYRAKIVPIGDLYTKAAKFDENGIVNNEYDKFLYTNTVGSVLQATATALTITGAETEANNVKINGATLFTADHLAQFEGQAVTLTAKVTKDGGTGVETGKVEFYRLDGSEWKLIGTVNVETQGTNTGVASTTYTMGAYDSTSAGASATTNKETFKAVYVANETYEKSETDGNAAVYIKSAKLMTPVIESTLAGKLDDTNKTAAQATTYEYNLTELLAGVQHTFKLRQDADQTAKDYSVVALDGRTVAAENYDIEWQYKTDGNFAKAGNDSTAEKYITTTTKVGDRYRVKLTGKGVFAGSEATSKDAVIGTKQDVTVTVKALDAIESTAATDVYQLNEITLTATVAAAKGADATMKPTGTVTFYYSVDGTNWTKIGEAKDLAEVAGVMTASIKTDQLPVKANDNTKQDVKITAVYSGDATFNASATVNETEKSITAAAGCTTTNDTVTVYSSVVFNCNDENKKQTTDGDKGIHISVSDGAFKTNEKATLALSDIYTLDRNLDKALLNTIAKLNPTTDYTIQWQKLNGATAITGSDYSAAKNWMDIDGATGTTLVLGKVEQNTAYRAVITVKNQPITKGSFDKLDQGVIGTADANDGRQVYYSNVLMPTDTNMTVSVALNTSKIGTENTEGITEGETVTANVFLSGVVGVVPNANVTVTVTNDSAKGNNTAYEKTFTSMNTVNGWNAFSWNTAESDDKGVPTAPGFYTLTVSATTNTGYAAKEITRSLIVRESSYTIAPSNTTVTYNGRTQGLTVTLDGFDFKGTGINEAANKSWTVRYEDANGNPVEPTQAGTYKAVITLPASAYWTEQRIEKTFTIKQRSVSIADAIAQAKVYDGTTDVNIVEVMLNDAETDQTTTGLPTNNVGIINGDSIYAVATAAALNSANAGNNSFKISTIELRGDDANNYVWNEAPYTEDIYVSRSQVYGVSSTDVTLKAGEKLPADAVYMIDQAGNKITTYDVLYYLHTDTEIKKVDNTNEKGLYTVIVRPKQDNYKSGVTLRVTVGDATGHTPAVAPKPSTLITISNTAELYGAATGVTASTTNSTATTTIEYQSGSTGWTTTAPTSAGRYLVRVTANTGDVAYGIYTITKAHPELTITPADTTYNSMPQNGYSALTGNNGTEGVDWHITYAGDVAIGYNTPADGNVDEQAPVDAGTYTVTLHVNETANYTAHEISKSFTIAKKALTIKADSWQTTQYDAFPDMTAGYTGLAAETGDTTTDTSLRDVQIAPEFLYNPTGGKSNYSNDSLDQVGGVAIQPIDALSKNYAITYENGQYTKQRTETNVDFAIHGLPQSGDRTVNRVYYGDEIQLYPYGYYTTHANGSGILEWSVTTATGFKGTVTIGKETGLLNVNGVGEFTVTLKRGVGEQQISTSVTVTAIQKEAKIALKNVDKVYTGASQTYAYEGNVTVHDELYQPIDKFVDSKLTRTNTARTNVGTQITTAQVTGALAYQSEIYGGKFTINDKEASVAPGEQSTVYGTPETFDTNPKYTVTNEVNSVAAVSGVNVASQTDAYNRLDVHDGYEILVAGAENMNYNVKYTTDETAADSAVTTYDGMKLYSTTTKAKNELNDATVYGEQANDLDWILDAVKSTTRDSVDYADNLADFDLTDTTGIFIKQDKDDCVGNAKTYKAANREEGNTSSTALAADRTATEKAADDNYELVFSSVTNAKAKNYRVDNNDVKNEKSTMTAPTGTVGFIGAAATSDNLIEGSANIAQRPIKLEKAVTDAQLYWRLPQSQLYTALVNILKAEENSVGRGLAKGHTIEDLDLSFTIKVGSTTYNVAKDGTDAINFAATGNATVTATVGDTNYKLEGGQYQFDIVLKNIQIEATYTTKTFTGFTVLIKVHNEDGAITPLNDAKGLSYKIFKKTGDTIDKTTAYASGTLTYQNRTAYDDKGVLCGVFTATYPQLPLLNSGETYFIQMYEYGVELKTNS